MDAVLPILAKTPESSAGLWITLAIVVVIVAIFIGILVYVARRSRTIEHPEEPQEK